MKSAGETRSPISSFAATPAKRSEIRFFLFIFYVAAVFLMGGGSRADISSLVILRPLAAIMIGVALLDLSAEQLRVAKPTLILLGTMIVLTAIQLIPLPPSWWLALPGRAGLAESYQMSGIALPWHPISLVPWRTWNSLFAFLIPIAGVLLYVRLSPQDQARSASIVLVIGGVTALLAIAQLLGKPGGPLYLYSVTNRSSGVGLFANRNHQAFFLACLLPIFALRILASSNRNEDGGMGRLALVVAVALFVAALLLATGSRGGIVLGGVGFLSMLLFFPKGLQRLRLPGSRSIDSRVVILSLLSLAALLMISISARTDALDRFADGDVEGEARWLFLEPIQQMITHSFPIGNGVGTFSEIFQWYEPEAILRATYANQAHNDLLDLVISFGIFGIIPLALALFFWARAVIELWRMRQGPTSGIAYRLLGVTIMLMLGIASILDYPLRVPSLAMLWVLALTWSTTDVSPVRQGNRGRRVRR